MSVLDLINTPLNDSEIEKIRIRLEKQLKKQEHRFGEITSYSTGITNSFTDTLLGKSQSNIFPEHSKKDAWFIHSFWYYENSETNFRYESLSKIVLIDNYGGFFKFSSKELKEGVFKKKFTHSLKYPLSSVLISLIKNWLPKPDVLKYDFHYRNKLERFMTDIKKINVNMLMKDNYIFNLEKNVFNLENLCFDLVDEKNILNESLKRTISLFDKVDIESEKEDELDYVLDYEKENELDEEIEENDFEYFENFDDEPSENMYDTFSEIILSLKNEINSLKVELSKSNEKQKQLSSLKLCDDFLEKKELNIIVEEMYTLTRWNELKKEIFKLKKNSKIPIIMKRTIYEIDKSFNVYHEISGLIGYIVFNKTELKIQIKNLTFR